MGLSDKLRHVAGFPKPGIDFVDITTVLADPTAFTEAYEGMCDAAASLAPFDVVVSPEARGFVFGAPLALRFCKGFVPARKAGKLPADTISYQYELEYGFEKIEMHSDSIKPGQRVLVVDDLLATGGTGLAIARLVERMDAHVAGFLSLVELKSLGGASHLASYRTSSVIQLP